MLSLKLIHNHYGKGWWRNKLSIDREQIRFIWWTNLRTIIRIPVQRLDVIIIGSVMDMTTLGIYKVYKEFAGLISRIGEPVNQAIFPEFAKLIGQQDSKQSIDITKKTMLLLSGVGALTFTSLFLSADFLIGHFFGNQYLTLSLALYLMIGAYTISFITVPINSLFIAAGFAKYSFFVLLFTNSIYLATAFGLGYLYGIFGLIAAYAIQLFLNKGLKIHLMKKHPNEWHSKVR
jgi:O-antigen/teichoic acid export membrane protein